MALFQSTIGYAHVFVCKSKYYLFRCMGVYKLFVILILNFHFLHFIYVYLQNIKNKKIKEKFATAAAAAVSLYCSLFGVLKTNKNKIWKIREKKKKKKKKTSMHTCIHTRAYFLINNCQFTFVVCTVYHHFGCDDYVTMNLYSVMVDFNFSSAYLRSRRFGTSSNAAVWYYTNGTWRCGLYGIVVSGRWWWTHL